METSKNINQPRSAGAGDARVSSGWLRFNENTKRAQTWWTKEIWN